MNNSGGISGNFSRLPDDFVVAKDTNMFLVCIVIYRTSLIDVLISIV